MVELALEALQAQLQAYLNCLELCQVFRKQTDDPYVREALGRLIEELQESLAAIAGQLRRRGVAPGGYEVDGTGQARIQDVLAMRSLHSQLLAVRGSLVQLVAGYTASPPFANADATNSAGPDPLAAQARRMLDGWDQHMREMKAHFDKSLPSC